MPKDEAAPSSHVVFISSFAIRLAILMGAAAAHVDGLVYRNLLRTAGDGNHPSSDNRDPPRQSIVISRACPSVGSEVARTKGRNGG